MKAFTALIMAVAAIGGSSTYDSAGAGGTSYGGTAPYDRGDAATHNSAP